MFDRPCTTSAECELDSTLVRSGRWRVLPVLLCISFLLAPNICWFVVGGRGELDEISLRALQGAFGVVLLLLSLVRSQPRLVASVAGVCAIPAVAATWYIFSFTVPADINALSLIAETGTSEARDFLTSAPIWVWVGTLLAILSAICAVLRPWRAPDRWPVRVFALLGGWIVLLMILVTFEPDESMFGPLPGDAPPSAARAALLASYPLGIPLLIMDYRVSREVVASAIERRRGHEFGAKLLPGNSNGRQIYVLVIGETGRGSRWQVNGYPRPTTPYMANRSDTVVFSQMSTPFVFTRLSVPAMLTRAGTKDSSRFNEGSLVAAFKEAGFRTAWISMQAPLGFHESMVSSYAAEADEIRFMNPSDYAARGLPDMDGVDALADYVRRQPADANLFVVLHTLGSHFKYTDRYPEEEAYFLPDRHGSNKVSLYDPSDAVYLSNAYDNSIRYTDKVLSSLFERLQGFGGESWVYYSADHGEAIFDGCDGSSGHGQFNAETQSVAAAFWASSAYARRNSDRIENLRARASTPLSTVMVFETLAGLGGLSMPGQRKGHDFSSEEAVAPPPARRYASCEISGD